MVVASNAAQNKLTFLVCLVSVLAMLSFALWPVFLTELGVISQLNNTELGLIGGAYFFLVMLSPLPFWSVRQTFGMQKSIYHRQLNQLYSMLCIFHFCQRILERLDYLGLCWSGACRNLHAGPADIKCPA